MTRMLRALLSLFIYLFELGGLEQYGIYYQRSWEHLEKSSVSKKFIGYGDDDDEYSRGSEEFANLLMLNLNVIGRTAVYFSLV